MNWKKLIPLSKRADAARHALECNGLNAVCAFGGAKTSLRKYDDDTLWEAAIHPGADVLRVVFLDAAEKVVGLDDEVARRAEASIAAILEQRDWWRYRALGLRHQKYDAMADRLDAEVQALDAFLLSHPETLADVSHLKFAALFGLDRQFLAQKYPGGHVGSIWTLVPDPAPLLPRLWARAKTEWPLLERAIVQARGASGHLEARALAPLAAWADELRRAPRTRQT